MYLKRLYPKSMHMYSILYITMHISMHMHVTP